MKNKLSFTIVGAFTLLLSACGLAVIPGSGNIVQETRNVQGYNQVVFSAPGELTIEQNGQEGLVIEADDNLLGYIQARVRGNVLYIYTEPEVIQLYPARPIRYSLDVGALTRVSLNGSGVIRSDALIASRLDFELNGSGDILIAAVKSESTSLGLNGSGEYRFDSLITNTLAVSINGSGDMTMEEVIAKTADVEITGPGELGMADILADTLHTTINGSGGSTLGGLVNQQTIFIQGSGSYDSKDLESQAATAKIIGSGDSEIWVTEELNVTITGSGDIFYRGKPAIVQTITGSGNVMNVARQ